jgi:hypothetical protein
MQTQSLVKPRISAKLSVMHLTSEEKLEAEHEFREFLRKYDLPQPDEVEYGFKCLRFYYREPKTCVVFDLDPDAEDEPEV